MNRIGYLTISAVLIATAYAGGTIRATQVATTTDQQAALSHGAGFYDMQTGEFRFGVPPVVLNDLTLQEAAKAVAQAATQAAKNMDTVPAHKPLPPIKH